VEILSAILNNISTDDPEQFDISIHESSDDLSRSLDFDNIELMVSSNCSYEDSTDDFNVHERLLSLSVHPDQALELTESSENDIKADSLCDFDTFLSRSDIVSSSGEESDACDELETCATNLLDEREACASIDHSTPVDVSSKQLLITTLEQFTVLNDTTTLIDPSLPSSETLCVEPLMITTCEDVTVLQNSDAGDSSEETEGSSSYQVNHTSPVSNN
jgi:hypothetical protein